MVHDRYKTIDDVFYCQIIQVATCISEIGFGLRPVGLGCILISMNVPILPDDVSSLHAEFPPVDKVF